MSRVHLLAILTLIGISGGAKLLSGCSTGNPIEPLPTGEGEISGLVVKGAVASATVRAYKLVDGKRGDEIAKTVTDASGAFVLPMGSTKGAVLLVADSFRPGAGRARAAPSVLSRCEAPSRMATHCCSHGSARRLFCRRCKRGWTTSGTASRFSACWN